MAEVISLALMGGFRSAAVLSLSFRNAVHGSLRRRAPFTQSGGCGGFAMGVKSDNEGRGNRVGIDEANQAPAGSGRTGGAD
jgi:hypothetical protein